MMRRYRIFQFNIIVLLLFQFNKCFLFSVIIAIYNTGRYLEECIISLISQTIGFERIQIILINDGSTDQSEEICLKYQKLYNQNIIYIKIKHSGVSKARNVGMSYAKGTFVNFLDADDKWDYQAFKYIYLFFKNFNDIDFVAGRIKFFEANDNFHPLDYKFYKTRIVNLSIEYDSIQLSASSSFFRKSLIEGNYFKEDVYYCEDSRFVNRILLLKQRMGLIREAIYYYRRRIDFTSAINTQKNNLEFYFGTINKVSKYLLNSSKVIYNSILPFIQFLIIYDIFWRIQSHAFYFLNSKNLKKYIEMIEEILYQIDDKYIIEQKIVSNKYKIFLLSKKYNRDLRYDIKLKNNSFIYSNHVIFDLKSNYSIFDWRIINLKNNKLYLEGIDKLWFPRGKYNYYFKIRNSTFYPKYHENSRYDFYTMYGLTQKGRTILFEIPLESIYGKQILYFYISYMDNNIEIFPSLGLFSHIPPLKNGYFISGNFIIKYYNKRLEVFQYNQLLEKKFENQYCYELKQNKKDIFVKLRKKIKCKNNKYKKYEIWIINDKKDKAGNNGEFFFRYLKLKRPKGIKSYFAINKNSDDFKRLRNIGDILDLNSNRYKILFIKSDKIISSVYDSWVDNPFKKDKIYIRDLLHFDFILLGNGMMTNDLSNFLNRFDKNFNLIMTSSKNEYKAFLNFNYGYNKNNVKLTGMPRFDLLSKFKIIRKKKIAIITTIGENFKEKKQIKHYQNIVSNKFNLTVFFDFYNNLINDRQLLLIMKKYNYQGFLCIHPSLKLMFNFHQNKFFSINEKCDLQELLFTASLFVIDYSNIFFDLGYLKKPIIYAHFDYEEYKMINHKGEKINFFKDGFGPICKNLECTISEMISHIKNIAFSDGKNSDRIFLYIINKIKTTTENEYFLINIFLIIFFNILLYKYYIY